MSGGGAVQPFLWIGVGWRVLSVVEEERLSLLSRKQRYQKCARLTGPGLRSVIGQAGALLGASRDSGLLGPEIWEILCPRSANQGAAG